MLPANQAGGGQPGATLGLSVDQIQSDGGVKVASAPAEVAGAGTSTTTAGDGKSAAARFASASHQQAQQTMFWDLDMGVHF